MGEQAAAHRRCVSSCGVLHIARFRVSDGRARGPGVQNAPQLHRLVRLRPVGVLDRHRAVVRELAFLRRKAGLVRLQREGRGGRKRRCRPAQFACEHTRVCRASSGGATGGDRAGEGPSLPVLCAAHARAGEKRGHSAQSQGSRRTQAVTALRVAEVVEHLVVDLRARRGEPRRGDWRAGRGEARRRTTFLPFVESLVPFIPALDEAGPPMVAQSGGKT